MPAGLYGQQKADGSPVYTPPSASTITRYTGQQVDPNEKVVAINTNDGSVRDAGTVGQGEAAGAAITAAKAGVAGGGQASEDDLQRARALSQGLILASQAPVSRPAPQVAAAPTVNAAQAVAPGFGPASMAQAAQAGPAQQIAAQQIAAAQAAAPPAAHAEP
jgi:hypothetical protein